MSPTTRNIRGTSRRRGSSGLSMLEVLAAMSLFAIVASAVGALASSSMLHTTQNRHYTIAAMLAQEELENLRGLDYVDLASRSSVSTESGMTYKVDSFVEPNVPANSMCRITVNVSWLGPEGPKSYEIQTIYTNVRG